MNSSILPVLVLLWGAVFLAPYVTVLCSQDCAELCWLTVQLCEVVTRYSACQKKMTLHSLLCSLQMCTTTLGPPYVTQHHVTMGQSHCDKITSHYSSLVCALMSVSHSAACSAMCPYQGPLHNTLEYSCVGTYGK